jgi:hypothetical protein
LIDVTKADDYRKRAETLRKRTQKRQSSVERDRLVRKSSALNDMANNEDWLDGKRASKLPDH